MDSKSGSEYTGSEYYSHISMEECHPNTPLSGNTNKFDLEMQLKNNLVEVQFHKNRQGSHTPPSNRQSWNIGQTSDSMVMAHSDMNNQFEIDGRQNHERFYNQRCPTNISKDSSSKSEYNRIESTDIGKQSIESVKNEQEKMLHDFNQESMKEVHAASNAIDNLGFNYSQDIKVILNDLSTRLQDKQVVFTTNFLQHPQWLNHNDMLMKNEMINSLTNMLTKERALNETQQELKDMKIQSMETQIEVFKMNVAEKAYDRKLKQRAFSNLRNSMLTSWKLRAESAENVSRTLGDNYIAAQDELHADVESLKRRMLLEKAEYESSIQDGLMKGLRSLNKEALKVMNLQCSNTDILCDAEQQTISQIFCHPNNKNHKHETTPRKANKIITPSTSHHSVTENSDDTGRPMDDELNRPTSSNLPRSAGKSSERNTARTSSNRQQNSKRRTK